METKELKIEVPEGFEIDKENSSFEKIVFKKKEDTKPRSWKEYVNKTEKNEIGYFIDTDTDIRCCGWSLCNCYSPHKWRNVLPTKELAEAFLAMMQLVSLRQAWIRKLPISYVINDWYCIKEGLDAKIISDIIVKPMTDAVEPLSFPTKEMAGDFMNTFEDLLEIAKPLL